MDLGFNAFDGRSWNIIDVTDKDTGLVVGIIKSKSSGLSGIEISLFDDKYRAIVGTSDECLGFVRGVQSVLNHLTRSPFIPPQVAAQTTIERRI